MPTVPPVGGLDRRPADPAYDDFFSGSIPLVVDPRATVGGSPVAGFQVVPKELVTVALLIPGPGALPLFVARLPHRLALVGGANALLLKPVVQRHAQGV